MGQLTRNTRMLQLEYHHFDPNEWMNLSNDCPLIWRSQIETSHVTPDEILLEKHWTYPASRSNFQRDVWDIYKDAASKIKILTFKKKYLKKEDWRGTHKLRDSRALSTKSKVWTSFQKSQL